MSRRVTGKSRAQLSRILSNTGCASAIELEIAPSTSAEAFLLLERLPSSR
jgi:hypothetical protein